MTKFDILLTHYYLRSQLATKIRFTKLKKKLLLLKIYLLITHIKYKTTVQK